MSDLKAYFNPRIHPEVVAGKKSCDEVSFIVFGALEVSQPATNKSTSNQQIISFAVSLNYTHPLIIFSLTIVICSLTVMAILKT